MLKRLKLTEYRGTSLTDDTIEAIRRLEKQSAHFGNVEVQFSGTSRRDMNWRGCETEPGPTKQPTFTSMRITGREVYLGLAYEEDPLVDEKTLKSREIALLWTICVPLGFVGWDRYPVVSDTQTVFHYLGPWGRLYDHLIGEGRGDAAWPSVCAAAQLDIGTWEGDRPIERFVQAQLHRIGLNPGPIDGQIRTRTLEAIRTTGLDTLPMDQIAKALAERSDAEQTTEERRIGHLIVPNSNITVSTFGGIKSTRTPQGAALTVDGPGRIVVDVEAGA